MRVGDACHPAVLIVPVGCSVPHGVRPCEGFVQHRIKRILRFGAPLIGIARQVSVSIVLIILHISQRIRLLHQAVPAVVFVSSGVPLCVRFGEDVVVPVVSIGEGIAQRILPLCQVVGAVISKYRRAAVFICDGGDIPRLVEGINFLPAFAVGFAGIPAAFIISISLHMPRRIRLRQRPVHGVVSIGYGIAISIGNRSRHRLCPLIMVGRRIAVPIGQGCTAVYLIVSAGNAPAAAVRYLHRILVIIISIRGHVPGEIRFRQDLPGAVVGKCPCRAVRPRLFYDAPFGVVLIAGGVPRFIRLFR